MKLPVFASKTVVFCLQKEMETFVFSYFRKGMRRTERGRGETKKGREKGRTRRKAGKG